jgi:hypothetical protein
LVQDSILLFLLSSAEKTATSIMGAADVVATVALKTVLRDSVKRL